MSISKISGIQLEIHEDFGRLSLAHKSRYFNVYFDADVRCTEILGCAWLTTMYEYTTCHLNKY